MFGGVVKGYCRRTEIGWKRERGALWYACTRIYLLSFIGPRTIAVVVFLRKNAINLVINIGNLFSPRLWMSLLWDTLSNAPDMSKLRRDAILLFFLSQMVCICSVSNSTTDIVDLFGRAPIGRNIYNKLVD